MTRVLVRNDFSVVASRNSIYAVYFVKAYFISANCLYVTPLGNRLRYFLTCRFHRYAWSHSSLTRLQVRKSLPCSSGRRKRVVSLNNGGIIFYDFPVSWRDERSRMFVVKLRGRTKIPTGRDHVGSNGLLCIIAEKDGIALVHRQKYNNCVA